MNNLRKKLIAIALSSTLLLSSASISSLAVDVNAKENPRIVEKKEVTNNVSTGQTSWVTVEGIEGGQVQFDASTGAIVASEQSITIANIPSQINGVAVTAIEAWAFEHCENLTKVTIPNSITLIEDGAFGYCISLTEIEIPKSVTKLWLDAFYDCDALESINVHTDNTTYSSIDGVLFNKDETILYLCPVAKTAQVYQIPNGVTEIQYAAFAECKNIKKVIIPDSITTIQQLAFAGFDSLTEIEIPQSVKTIEYGAFDGCGSLKEIFIPKSVSDIGYSIFGNCYSLESVTVDSENENFSSLDGVLFDKEKTLLHTYPMAKVNTSYTIPETVEIMGDDAFVKVESLKHLTIGNNVTTMNEYPFEDCYNLESITVGEDNLNYSSIDGVLFNKDVTKLITYPSSKQDTEYIVPKSVKTFGNIAFNECDYLKRITLPKDIEDFTVAVFFSCYNLQYVNVPNSITDFEMFFDVGFLYCRNVTFLINANNDDAILYAEDNYIDYMIYGNSNEDSEITISDVITLQQYLAKSLALTDEKISASDVSGDGEITISDVILVQQYLANIISEF